MNHLQHLQWGLDRFTLAVMPVALPIAGLLWAQWPLRELIGAGSIQANDMAQWLFALYVGVAVRHAGRRGQHLVAHPGHPSTGLAPLAHSFWRTRGASLCVLPWALYLTWSAATPAWQSLRALERFAESLSPGYFVVKLAACLLGVLLTLQCVIDLWAGTPPSTPSNTHGNPHQESPWAG